jgi:hypothetical protein
MLPFIFCNKPIETSSFVLDNIPNNTELLFFDNLQNLNLYQNLKGSNELKELKEWKGFSESGSNPQQILNTSNPPNSVWLESTHVIAKRTFVPAKYIGHIIEIFIELFGSNKDTPLIFARIIKPSEHKIKVFCVDNTQCLNIVVSIFSHDGNYAIEFQRRSGNSILYSNIYNCVLRQLMKKDGIIPRLIPQLVFQSVPQSVSQSVSQSVPQSVPQLVPQSVPRPRCNIDVFKLEDVSDNEISEGILALYQICLSDFDDVKGQAIISLCNFIQNANNIAIICARNDTTKMLIELFNKEFIRYSKIFSDDICAIAKLIPLSRAITILGGTYPIKV